MLVNCAINRKILDLYTKRGSVAKSGMAETAWLISSPTHEVNKIISTVKCLSTIFIGEALANTYIHAIRVIYFHTNIHSHNKHMHIYVCTYIGTVVGF